MDRVYDERINWENEPSVNTPINEGNLNKMDYAIFIIDGRVVEQSTTKANQSDLLQSIKSVEYETSTGIFTFTWWNGQVKTIDLAVEKIPVSFSMDENGIITMTNADGTSYTADVGAMIKYYTFENSDRITFTMIPDGKNYKVAADIVKGSITGEYLQPNYLADVTAQATQATARATEAKSYAVGGTGTREGEEADNAKYYCEKAKSIVGIDIATTDKAGLVKIPTDGSIEIDPDGTIHAQGGASPSVEKSIAENWQGTGYNLILYPYRDGASVTRNGITWTVNADGSITANGTCTASHSFNVNYPTEIERLVKLDKNKKYAYLNPLKTDMAGTCVCGCRWYEKDITPSSSNGTNTNLANVDVLIKSGYVYAYSYICVYAGKTLNNITFKPMLVEVAEDGSYPTEYQRYADGNVNLTDKVNNITESIEGIKGDIEDIQGDVEDLTNELTASDGLNFRFATDGEGNYGYLKADDSFVPFKSGSDKYALLKSTTPPSTCTSKEGFQRWEMTYEIKGYKSVTIDYVMKASGISYIRDNDPSERGFPGSGGNSYISNSGTIDLTGTTILTLIFSARGDLYNTAGYITNMTWNED